MAESIGSLQLTVEVESIDPKKVLEQTKAQLDEIYNAAKEASKEMDKAGETVVDSANDMTAAAEETAASVADVSDSLSDVADTADDAATATAKLAENMGDAAQTDTAEAVTETAEAVGNLADESASAAAATDRLNETNTEAVHWTREWGDKVFELTKRLAELIRQGEGESDTAKDIRKQLEELLIVHQDLAENPPFTDEQKAVLAEYRNELEQLNAAMEESDSTSAAAEAAEEMTEAVAEAAEKTEKMTEETKKGGAAAKQSGGFWQWLGKILHIKLPAGATAAKFAIEALKTALSAGLLTVITMLSKAIMKLVDKLTFSFRIQGELNKSVANDTAKSIASLKSLQAQWNALGNDLQQKEKFINDNKSAFDALGVSITSVSEAERLLVTHTNKFISAIMARARASAAQSMIIKATQDSIEDLAEAEGEISEAQARRDQAQKDYDKYYAEMQQTAGTRFRRGKDGLVSIIENDKNFKHSKQLLDAANIIRLSNKQIDEATKERDAVYKKIEEQSANFQKIIVQSNEDADLAFREGAFDESEDLKNYKNYLSDKKAAYKLYAQAMTSTNAEVRKNAATTAGVEIEKGKTYLAFLQKELADLKKKIADPNDEMLDFNKNRYKMLLKEIANETQPDKKTKKEDDLTYYEKLKTALKEVNEQRAKGFRPDPAIVANLKQQIELYEKEHGLFDYSGEIANLREFAEKVVAVEQQRHDAVEKIKGDKTISDDDRESQLKTLWRLRDDDIELLKSEYGIVGDDLSNAILAGMKKAFVYGEEDLMQQIQTVRTNLATAVENQAANGTNNGEEIAKLHAQLIALTTAWENYKKKATEASDTTDKAAKKFPDKEFNRLNSALKSCAQSFKTVGQEIGGTAGEALDFVGTLTDNVMGTISAIRTFGEMTSQTIKGVSVATATAIKTVETASVILAVISAALQIAMQIIQLFKKDEETYEQKKQVYDAYIDTLDTLIERERKLTETLNAQDAALSYSKIQKYYEDKMKVEREAGKAFLDSGASWKSHSEGYKLNRDLGQDDWWRISNALQDIPGYNPAKKTQAVMHGRQGTYMYGDAAEILQLTAEQLKAIQESANETYAKFPQEMRNAIDAIIEADEAVKRLEYDQMETATGMSIEAFKDQFLDSLYDMDVTAAKVSENIHENLRKGLILQLYKNEYQKDIEDYYKLWGKAMEDDGAISDTEQQQLDQLEQKITKGIEERVGAINDKFKVDEIDEEGGLQGAIKGASQESIDLLAGQTNAVRINQVTGIEIARDSLAATLEINANVIICATMLRSINDAVGGQVFATDGDSRAQGSVHR